MPYSALLSKLFFSVSLWLILPPIKNIEWGSLSKKFLLWAEIDSVEKRVFLNNLKNFDIIDFSKNLLLDVVFYALSREGEKKNFTLSARQFNPPTQLAKYYANTVVSKKKTFSISLYLINFLIIILDLNFTLIPLVPFLSACSKIKVPQSSVKVQKLE